MSSKKTKPNFGILSRIRRTPYQAMAAIFTVFLTLYMIGIVGMVGVGSAVVLKHFETKPQVTAFFKADVTPTDDQVATIENHLKASSKIASIRYINKDEALSIYKALFKDDPILLELVTAKMLPASLEVTSTDPNYLPQISDQLKKEPDIDQVIFQADVVRSLTQWTSALRKLGVGIAAIFLAEAIVIIAVILSLKVSLRREEIGIISLLGGNSWYIYRPFLAEGLIYGLVGAFISWFANVLTLLYATPFLISFLAGIPLFPIPLTFYPMLLTAELILGLAIGLVGSAVALRRYLPK